MKNCNHIYKPKTIKIKDPNDKLCFGTDIKNNLENRLCMFKKSLIYMLGKVTEWGYSKVGLPLCHSGLAADKQLKGNKTDLEYFKEYILPTIEEVLSNYPNIELTIVNYQK